MTIIGGGNKCANSLESTCWRRRERKRGCKIHLISLAKVQASPRRHKQFTVPQPSVTANASWNQLLILRGSVWFEASCNVLCDCFKTPTTATNRKNCVCGWQWKTQSCLIWIASMSRKELLLVGLDRRYVGTKKSEPRRASRGSTREDMLHQKIFYIFTLIKNKRESDGHNSTLILTDNLWISGDGGSIFDEASGLSCVFDMH
ncbi:hypothetical protein YC2023_009912 [Brassica napus]